MVSGGCFSGVPQFSVTKCSPAVSAMFLKRIGPGAGLSARTAHTQAASKPTAGPHRAKGILSRSFGRFPDGEDTIHRQIAQRLDRAAGPGDLERPHGAIPSQTKMHALVASGEVTAAGRNGGVLAGSGLAHQMDTRANAIAIARRPHCVNGQPVIGASLMRA